MLTRMTLDRLNPVLLITGAGAGFGAACAINMARRAQGGLLLVDHDGDALSALADELDAQNLAPERVSTLAFDVADEQRWAQAAAFIGAQYGRVDWAILNVAPPPPQEAGDLVQWGPRLPANLDSAALSLRALMPLMGANALGGAAVVTAAAESILGDPNQGLPRLVRVAANEGAAYNVRVNGFAPSAADAPLWSNLPWFHELARTHGGAREALAQLAAATPPIARYRAGGDTAKLVGLLLSDDAEASAVTLLVDGGYAI